MLLISFLITNKNGRTMLRTLSLLLLCFPAVGTLAQTQLTTSEIKAIADYITEHVNQDGFVKAIDKFVWEKENV